MPLFNVQVNVFLQPAILDPKGKAARSALEQLGFAAVKDVRINKSVQMAIEAPSAEEALKIADISAHKLLANPITERFTVSLV
jgi:phosphoribosylformylglycinamidine synthase